MQQSEVELFWQAICAKSGINKPWGALHHQEQMMVLQAINMLLSVLHN